jgi:YrbI family 3-deoxy-D-manno-octulosonate 8-phosphate phosphatase
MVSLTIEEQRRRARAVRLVVTDCDGVLTDGCVYYSARGEELMCFSRRDGMGIELLAKAGLPTAIVTREDSDIVRARAKKLELHHVFMGVRDKVGFLTDLEAKTGVTRDAMAYIGDDINDIEVMLCVALAGAPLDGAQAAQRVAHRITQAPAGKGAFREFAEWILQLRT